MMKVKKQMSNNDETRLWQILGRIEQKVDNVAEVQKESVSETTLKQSIELVRQDFSSKIIELKTELDIRTKWTSKFLNKLCDFIVYSLAVGAIVLIVSVFKGIGKDAIASDTSKIVDRVLKNADD